MRRFDARLQRELKRTMSGWHSRLAIGALFTVAVALALLGRPELAICVYVATGFGFSIVFKEIYWRGQNAEKKAKQIA